MPEKPRQKYHNAALTVVQSSTTRVVEKGKSKTARLQATAGYIKRVDAQ